MAKQTVPSTNNLRKLRMRGIILTQEQVAKLIGLDNTTVSRHESGQIKLDSDNLTAYAILYGVETHQVFFDSDADPMNCAVCGQQVAR